MAALNIPAASRVVASALRKLGVTPTSYTYNNVQYTEAQVALNALIKEFQTLGMQAYLISSLPIPLQSGSSVYRFGELLPGAVPFPTYIYKAMLVQPTGEQIEMNSYTISDFTNLPQESTGTPVNFVYLVGVTTADLVVWPTPDTSVPVGTKIVVYYQRQIDVVDNENDVLDFPGEWENAITYNLAVLLADEYGIPEQKKAWLEKQADKHLNTALSNTGEQGSFVITPNGEGWDYPNQY